MTRLLGLALAFVLAGCDSKSGSQAGKNTDQAAVLLLRYAESSASTNEREQGFLEALKAGPSAPTTQAASAPGGGSAPSALPILVSNNTGKRLRIMVIPKGLTHEHWKAVEAGARKAGQEAGNVEIVWQGPPKEDDTNQQINLVQSCISGGIHGIVLAPLSDQSLVAPVRAATKAGIPVVIIDSGLQGTLGKDFVAYVGTNNKAAGVLAGQRMAGLVAAANPGVIDPPQYAGADVNSAKRAAENMITAYQGQFTAIFCPNESSTEGMLLALNDRQLSGKTIFVGFDVNKRLIDALKAGKIQGLVLQNPFKMGYEGVRVLLAHMNGDPVPTDVDTGAVLVTPENLSTPEINAVVPTSAK